MSLVHLISVGGAIKPPVAGLFLNSKLYVHGNSSVSNIITVIELPEGTEQNHNTPVSIIVVQAEIRTRNL
jgi:hypothetical protein